MGRSSTGPKDEAGEPAQNTDSNKMKNEIKLYTACKAFLFKLGDETLGFAPYDTLELDHARKATPEQITDMRYQLKEFTAGETVNGRLLGPKRDFTHEVTLRAYGNPDHQQYTDIGPRKTVKVCGIEEAAAAFEAYRDQYRLGGGNCGPDSGVVWDITGPRRRKVGFICYNGEFKSAAERKASWAKLRKLRVSC